MWNANTRHRWHDRQQVHWAVTREVLVRSWSTEGESLAAAKRELQASIHGVAHVQQFQIVFYNERARAVQPPQMSFADENDLRQADSFVASVSASGGTDHVQALLPGLRMKPDVIFFLNDADEPQLTAKELETIWKSNEGTIINVVVRGKDTFQKATEIRARGSIFGRRTCTDWNWQRACPQTGGAQDVDFGGRREF